MAASPGALIRPSSATSSNSSTCAVPARAASRAAVPITVSDGERLVLQARAGRARAEQRDALRAKIVLAAAEGLTNALIAARFAITDDTARKWRGRFAASGLAGEGDRLQFDGSSNGESSPQQSVARRWHRVQANRTRRRWLSRFRKP